MRKITHEEYAAKVAEQRPGFVVLEPYVNAKTKIDHQCPEGHIWKVNPGNFRKGKGCAHCQGRATVTEDAYRKRLEEDGRGYRLVGDWLGTNKKTLHECPRGHQWSVKPSHITSSGAGCTGCEADKRGWDMPRGGWTLDACLAVTLNYSAVGDWREGHPRSYDAAKRMGWCEQCTAHMTRQTQPNGYWTFERCLEAARQYKTINEWAAESPGSRDASLRNGWDDRCTAHMVPGDRRGDVDAVYLWEWVEDGKGTGIYKVGVTTFRNGDSRPRGCARTNQIEINLIALCQTSPGDARRFEKLLLDMGDTVALPDHIVDGRTEFRIYNAEELAFIYELLGVNEQAAMAA